MKTPNKREFQQIVSNHLSRIGFEDFMNIHKKYSAKTYSFLVIDTTFTSVNQLRFRHNLLER